MNKNLLTLLLLLITLLVNAQTKQSVVTLKNGTELKGVIKSIDPTDAVVIDIAGVEATVKMADVAKIEEVKDEGLTNHVDHDEVSFKKNTANQSNQFVAVSGNVRFFFNVLSESDKTVEIIKNKNIIIEEENVLIPSTIEYKGQVYTVIGIGEEAFSQNKKIKSVKIPNTIIYIGEEAFEGCTKLEKIEFSVGLEIIGEQAFALCIKLSAVELPQGLLRVEEQAFQFCPLEKVDIPNTVTYIGRRAFFSGNTSIGQESRIKWLSIPESVIEIGKQAFCKFINLMGTALPSKCHIELLPSWMDESNAKRVGISVDSFRDYKKK